ncbi:MAG: aspartyl/asparaginyl beta-hydroxylase domain-containing protein [Verrucomicrobia bacterium]|nr:aspartyl/asparaginyl beta-hydroxylase domain-containing protein [Verrucomicrobiota bacterium]
MQFTRPTHGIARLDAIKFDAKALQKDLDKVLESDWRRRDVGQGWADLMLYQNGEKHRLFDQCQEIRRAIESFDAELLDACLALLEPGGTVKEHRDISGGTPMGVARFHIPIVTHPDVEFYVNGKRLFLDEGEVWSVDTSYPHRLHNHSDVARIHLIVDVKMNDTIRAMLPKLSFREYLHKIYFVGICLWKGLSLVFRPKELWQRVRDIFALIFTGESRL